MVNGLYKRSHKFLLLGVLLFLIIFFGVSSPSFFTVNNAFSILRQVSLVGIASIGMMFVLLTGGIDLSVGSQVAFVNILCAYLMVNIDINPIWAVLITLFFAGLSGYIIGVLVTKINIPPIIVTLSFMMILKGVALTISKGLPISGLPRNFNILGQGYFWIIPIPVILTVALFSFGVFILTKTYMGKYYYAIGGNREAARLSGINVGFYIRMVYLANSLFAAFAGIIALSRLNSGSPQTGNMFEFEVITAVILGGVSITGGSGKISGVIIGVLIMGVLANGLIMTGVSQYSQQIIRGLVLIVAVGMDCIQKESSFSGKK